MAVREGSDNPRGCEFSNSWSRIGYYHFGEDKPLAGWKRLPASFHDRVDWHRDCQLGRYLSLTQPWPHEVLSSRFLCLCQVECMTKFPHIHGLLSTTGLNDRYWHTESCLLFKIRAAEWPFIYNLLQLHDSLGKTSFPFKWHFPLKLTSPCSACLTHHVSCHMVSWNTEELFKV